MVEGSLKIDPQGRLVVPQDARRRLGIDGRAAELDLRPTSDGIELVLPTARATVAASQEDGLPVVTLDDRTDAITNDEILQALHRERAVR